MLVELFLVVLLVSCRKLSNPYIVFATLSSILWTLSQKLKKGNWVFVTNSDFLIPIFFHPDGVNLWYFKLRFLSNIIHSLKYLRSTALDYKDIEIRKS